MKKSFVWIVGMVLTYHASAQWQGTNPVYFNAGNVGIGTSNPQYFKLDILSQSSNEAGIRSTASSGGNSTFSLVAYTSSYTTVPSYANKTVWQTSDNPIVLSAFGTNSNNQIQFYTGGRTEAFKRMVLDQNGAFGIGTATPGSRLHVADGYNGDQLKLSRGTGAVRFIQETDLDNLYLYNRDLTKVYMAWKQNGNVGIGTSTPRSPLEVTVTGDNNTVQTGLIVQQVNPTAPNNSAGVSLDFGVGNNWTNNNIEGKITVKETYWSVNPKMVFSLLDPHPGNVMRERMVIDTYGNVGIGTSNPSSRLAVRATTVSPGLIIGNVDGVGQQSHFGLTTADQSSIGLATESYFNIYNDGYWHFNSGNTNGTTLPITFSTNCMPRLFIEPGGNVAIGTTDAKGYKLAIAGKMVSEEVVVKLMANWPDYVFEEEYKLPSLAELQLFITKNKHLPGVPTADEVKKDGVALGEMNAILLQKIEELTLHLIEQNKKIEDQQIRIEQLTKKMDERN